MADSLIGDVVQQAVDITGVRYIKNRKEAKDLKVLEIHPFVQTWRESLPYLHNSTLAANGHLV